jgi:hypothetical protein
VHRDANIGRRAKGAEKEPRRGVTHEQTRASAENREEQVLRQQLANDAGSGGSENDANGDLAFAGYVFCQKHVGQVGTGGKENKEDQREEKK